MPGACMPFRVLVVLVVCVCVMLGVRQLGPIGCRLGRSFGKYWTRNIQTLRGQCLQQAPLHAFTLTCLKPPYCRRAPPRKSSSSVSVNSECCLGVQGSDVYDPGFRVKGFGNRL